MSRTFFDPDHSREEDRYITIGLSADDRIIIMSHCDREDRIRIISVRTELDGNEGYTKMTESPSTNDDLRPEYDQSSLKDGVRGKYAEQYAAGTNLVRLAPDVAAVFSDDDAVNEALRLIMRVADDTSRITGRSSGRA